MHWVMSSVEMIGPFSVFIRHSFCNWGMSREQGPNKQLVHSNIMVFCSILSIRLCVKMPIEIVCSRMVWVSFDKDCRLQVVHCLEPVWLVLTWQWCNASILVLCCMQGCDCTSHPGSPGNGFVYQILMAFLASSLFVFVICSHIARTLRPFLVDQERTASKCGSSPGTLLL